MRSRIPGILAAVLAVAALGFLLIRDRPQVEPGPLEPESEIQPSGPKKADRVTVKPKSHGEKSETLLERPAEPLVAVDPREPVQRVSEAVAGVNTGQRPDFVQGVAPIAAQLRTLHTKGTTVREDLDLLSVAFDSYHRAFKEMPVAGYNAEFVELLIGKNSKGFQVLPHDHAAINEKGELTDRWGTPYFFHPMSERKVEIISAGPDRKMYTADDVSATDL